jgi:hypothetical protein
MNFPFHVRDLQVDENMNYTSLIWKFDTKEEQDLAQLQQKFRQNILVDDFVVDE